MLVSDAFSAGLMAIAVNSLKYTCRVRRPDGSSRNSFPSGHTATAFMTATMLHKEYGHRSPGTASADMPSPPLPESPGSSTTATG